MTLYPITPVPRPRETQRDKWNPRKCVQRFRWFRDLVKSYGVELPVSGAHVIFTIEMPKSWSNKKKAKMDGRPHQQTPDLDNMLKALSDSVYSEDKIIYDIRVSKKWGKNGSIEVIENWRDCHKKERVDGKTSQSS